MPTFSSRALGALLALHAGDSLGASLEFSSHARIAKDYPNGLGDIIGGGPFGWEPGHATDDTDMTRGMLLAYRDQWRAQQEKKRQKQKQQDEESDKSDDDDDDDDKDQEVLKDIVHRTGDYFLSWLQGHNWPDRRPGSYPVDIGGATVRSLQRLLDSGDPFTSGDDGPDTRNSAGNGSLMRCSPTALMCHSDRERLVKESLALSAITHADPRCTTSCAAYNVILASLLHSEPPSAAVAKGLAAAEKLEPCGTAEAIELGQRLSIATLAANGPPKRDLPGGCAGYVLETLTVAVAAVLDGRELRDVLVDVVRIGRDTDTNAAVAGGLLGARDGVEAIPMEWREVLQFGEEFEDVVKEITHE